jgi:hypothetical protein
MAVCRATVSTRWSGSAINVSGGRDLGRQRRRREHDHHHSSLHPIPLWCRSCWAARWDRTLWPSRRARIQCTVCMTFSKMGKEHHQQQNRPRHRRRRRHHRRCRRTSSGKKTRRKWTIFTRLRDGENNKQHVADSKQCEIPKNRLRTLCFKKHMSIKLSLIWFSALVDQGAGLVEQFSLYIILR